MLRKARKMAARNRESIGPELAVASVQRAHTRAANAFQKRSSTGDTAKIRPQVLSRMAKRVVLPELRLDLADHVFVSEINSTATGWKWAKAHPHLTVTMHMDREIDAPKSERVSRHQRRRPRPEFRSGPSPLPDLVSKRSAKARRSLRGPAADDGRSCPRRA